jgi:hypothetical protein
VLATEPHSEALPFSAIDEEQLACIRDTVRLALRFASASRPLTFDDAARERWINLYAQLTAPQPGLAGATTARAEAHVVRLALIDALLDRSRADPPAAPRGRPGGLELQRRLGAVGVRRQPRRPDRR